MSWAVFDAMMSGVKSMIDRDCDKISTVVGISRGGLIPATILSHHTGARLIPFDIKNDRISQNVITEYVGGGNILVVDDICDTGNTFRSFNDMLNSIMVGVSPSHIKGSIQYVSLIQNISSNYTSDIYSMEIDKLIKNYWIVFPWENPND